MFSSLNKNTFQKISFRLSFIFGLFFITSSILVLLTSYLLFEKSLKLKDEGVLKAKIKEYSSLYNKSGLISLQNQLIQEKESDLDSQFLVAIRNKDLKNILVKVPETKQELESEFNKKIALIVPSDTIVQFSVLDTMSTDPSEEDSYEVGTVHLFDGSVLYVGHDNSDREDLLERYLDNLLITVGIVFLVGILGGFYFSSKALDPLRHLIQTMKKLYSGDLNARVPVRNSNDELDQIGQLFNKMAAKIEKLVLGMQETLDQVAHDLKTPLTRLKARSELALLTQFSENDYKAALASNIENTTEIVNLIDTIMDISEAQVGILRLNLKSINVTKALLEVIDLYTIIAEEKNILLELFVSQELVIFADESRFKQVISNLIANAIKYSHRDTSIKIMSQIKNSSNEIIIDDQGIGISKEDLPKIWNRLFRGDEAKSEKGLGLGLSLVQSICKAHGWKIEVESQKNVGSRFKLSFGPSS